jgi:threonine dehydrogenase-like Zn-dependent dehydrogenase
LTSPDPASGGPEPHPIGHEYAGVVVETGRDVTTIKPGQLVIGSFFASDGTCPNCRAGYQTSCIHRELVNGCRAEYVRVPLADGHPGRHPGPAGA